MIDLSSMKVKDLMIREVFTVQVNDPFAEIAKKMLMRSITGIIVVEGNKPVGVISALDIIKIALVSDASLKKEVTAKDLIAKKPLITLREEMGIIDALKLMINNKVRKLPVVNEEGELVGALSMFDVIKLITEVEGE